MILRVTQFGEPILRQKGKPVDAFDDGLKKLVADMLDTMYAEEGIGLAAQQIGRALQLFVLDLSVRQKDVDFHYTLDGRTPPLDLIMPMAMVNPIVETSGTPYAYDEGCLSFPGVRGLVTRPSEVNVRFQDTEGTRHHLACDGIFARVILHEYDHILGKLFIEHMSPETVRGLESKLKKIKRASRDFLKRQKRHQ